MNVIRYVIYGISAYLIYLLAKCPCDKLLSCSLPQFGIGVVLLSGLVLIENK